MQTRSYPSSFGGNNATSGYEFFESFALVDHAKETGQELLKLFDAEKCPSGEIDLILNGDQLLLCKYMKAADIQQNLIGC
ncbi:MAG: hypothetical protein QMD23_02235 [Candidatus Bathyarchaeia archaeon]|nr:hypothetical protein [Candidatus Bathyarchaeia archaeon]